MSETISPKPPVEQQTQMVEIPTARTRPTLSQLLRQDLGFLPVMFTLIVIAIYFQATTGGLFLTPRNISNLILQIGEIGIIGLGAALVLLLGEIDLSLAAVATMSSVAMGVLSERMNMGPWEAVLIGILIGAGAGLINGVFIAILRIPSFIVTLAASIGYSGLLLFSLAGDSSLVIHDPTLISLSGTYLSNLVGTGIPVVVILLYIASVLINEVRRRRAGLRTKSVGALAIQIGLVVLLGGGVLVLFNSYLGVPSAAALLILFILLVWLLLVKTGFGRHVYAVGGNIEAARRAGINVVGIRLVVFTMASTLAAIGGILAASRGLSVSSQIDPTLLLNGIASAVIGGVSLFGGQGSVWSIILGALIIGSLENGLDLRSQGTDVKQMIEGAVLLLAVTVDALTRRAQARSRSGR
jgi:D-xylose transport system permease protein